MKTKQLFLTGMLIVATIIGTSAHDKGMKNPQGTHKAILLHIAAPASMVQVPTPGDWEGITAGLMSQSQEQQNQEKENVELLTEKRNDWRITESGSTAGFMDESLAAALAQLATQQQQEALLTTWKKTADQMTESNN